jgi:hypothetical protein
MRIFTNLLYLLRLTYAFVSVPEPSGPFSVGYNTMKVTDESRIDPYAPHPRARAVMISAFYPVARDQCKRTTPIHYMPLKTATFVNSEYASFGVPNGTFERLRLQMCCKTSLIDDFQHAPIVLFSPGLGNSRLLYSAMAQSVASLGYFVVTIDHPYDGNIVEFPDGSLIFAANFTLNLTSLAYAIHTRAHDASFVLSQLGNASVVSQLVHGAECGLDVHAAAMFGHSLGGAATLAAMELDSRIKGGSNLDGTFFGGEIDKGTNHPFLIFGNKIHNRTSDISWEDTWQNLKGWKLGLMLKESGHGTFSDLPLLVKVLGMRPFLPPDALDLIGTIDGARAREIIVTYVTTFIDFALFRKDSKLLQRPSANFPEIVFDTSVPDPVFLGSNRPSENYVN